MVVPVLVALGSGIPRSVTCDWQEEAAGDVAFGCTGVCTEDDAVFEEAPDDRGTCARRFGERKPSILEEGISRSL